MITRTQIERILAINGLSPVSSDDEVRSVLLSAKFTKEEADSAIQTLRHTRGVGMSRIDGLQKVFRTDKALKPVEISDLLGIEVSIEGEAKPKSKARTLNAMHIISIIVFATMLSAGLLVLAMYFGELGPFMETTTY